MTERVERVVAGVVALAANLLIGAYLLHMVSPNRTSTSAPDEAIQVVFLQKEVPRLTPATPRAARRTTAHPSNVPTPARRLSPSPAVASPRALHVVTLPESTPAADDWGLTRSAQGKDPGRPDFKRNPLARRPPPITASVDRMRLKMRDRSFGGVLQAMTKSSICGDLRRALLASPASANAILASMDEAGCSRM